VKGKLKVVTAEAGSSWSIDDAGFVTIEVFDRSQKNEVVASLTKPEITLDNDFVQNGAPFYGYEYCLEFHFWFDSLGCPSICLSAC
jgi:hypothetical protein